MPLQGRLSSIFFAIVLACGLYGCLPWDFTSEAEYQALYAERLEQIRIYDSLAGDRNAAFNFLRNIHALGRGGGRGSISYPVATAFRTIIAQPDAPVLFTRLIREGSCAGQIYGLAGLQAVDSVLFARELPSFLARTDSVKYYMGCFTWKQSMAQTAMATQVLLPPGTWQSPIKEDIYSGVFLRNLMSER